MKLKYTLILAASLLAAASEAATLTVLNTNDNLAGSLRQAIQDAAPGDKIVFNIPSGDPGYNPTTRTFTIQLVQPSPSDPSAGLVIAKNLTIDGGTSRIVVSRANNAPHFGVFSVAMGTVTLMRLTISGGLDSNSDGNGIRNAGNLTIDRCAIINNGGSISGSIGTGAVMNRGLLTLVDSTIAFNACVQNATIENAPGATLTLRSCTVVQNDGAGPPRGIRNAGSAQVGNCVVAQNGTGAYGDAVGAFTSDGYNFIGAVSGYAGAGGSTGFGLPGSHDQLGTYDVPADPNLGAFQDNGGVTKTMLPLAGSPLVDQGSNFGLVVDQRDRLRPIDNPAIANAGDSSDIGAVETDVRQAGPNFVVNTTDEHSDQFCGIQDCSLWDAANAAGGDTSHNNTTITFAPNVVGTITTALQASGIGISRPYNIVGPGARLLTISGAGVARVFYIASGGAVTISGLTIANGSINTSGGGILNAGGLTLTGCMLLNNTAGSAGGAIENASSASLTINRCTFSGNQASSVGGAIDNQAAISVTNSSFFDNSADAGGTVSMDGTGSTETFLNCTISGNTAQENGGGICVIHGTAHLGNTIVAGNTGTSAPDLSGNFVSDGFNLVGKNDGSLGFTNRVNSDQVGTAAAPIDAKLGPLNNTGGPTDTMRPLIGSRAIDQANPNSPAIDQRAMPRPQGAAPDIGAVEVAPVVENGDAFVQYDGWAGVKNANANGGAYRMSNVSGDTVTYTFTGTSIKWITPKGANMGKALVTIDGVSKGTYDLYSASLLWNQQIAFSGLTNSAHTIVVRVAGTKNANATGYNVGLDGFLVGSATTAVQESANSVQYNSWKGIKQSAASGGSYRTNGNLGAVVRFRFNGSSIILVTTRGPSYGKVNVLIDGVTKSANLDLYAAGAQWQYWQKYSGLTNANHTIEIHSTHTKNAGSSGYGVVVDAFTGPFTALP